MEKNYSERVREIKNEVLNEIRDILGTDARHKFANPFCIHYVEGKVATTETCIAVEVYGDGMVCFSTSKKSSPTWKEEEMIEGETVYQYEPNSFFDILDNLKKEIREKKLNALRELVKKAGGEIDFDGNFEFFGTRGTTVQKTKLMGVEIDDKGEFTFDCIAAEDGECWRHDSYPDTDQLDGIIEYVRKQTEKTPEERMALTDEQQKLFRKLRETLTAMFDNNVGFIMNDNNKLIYAYNKADFDQFETSRYIDENKGKESFSEVDYEELPLVGGILDFYVYSDESLYVKFK